MKIKQISEIYWNSLNSTQDFFLPSNNQSNTICAVMRLFQNNCACMKPYTPYYYYHLEVINDFQYEWQTDCFNNTPDSPLLQMYSTSTYFHSSRLQKAHGKLNEKIGLSYSKKKKKRNPFDRESLKIYGK